MPIGEAAAPEQGQARQSARPVEEDAAQDAVLDDVAERHRIAVSRDELATVVMQEQRRLVVGDADLADRLGVAGDVGPQPDPVEHQPRAIGDRRGTPIEAAVEHRGRVLRIDDRDREARAGAGNSEQHPVQPGAGDHQLGIIGHEITMGAARCGVQGKVERSGLLPNPGNAVAARRHRW